MFKLIFSFRQFVFPSPNVLALSSGGGTNTTSGRDIQAVGGDITYDLLVGMGRTGSQIFDFIIYISAKLFYNDVATHGLLCEQNCINNKWAFATVTRHP